jgi:3-(3-hydroxy-phenyl)propionate hydroxylase
MLKPSTVERLLHSHGAAPGSQLTRKVVYTFHARIAQRWHQGRVFLAGDAAHLSPPFAGQGMNSGVRDAHNLAWKLAAVVEGRLGSALLDSYEQERRGHVEQMIQLALHMGKIMAPASRATGWLMQTALRVLSIWPFMRDYFGQMKYKPKPYFERGFFVRERPDRSQLVGRLLPQPHVRRIDGTIVLLDEVLGIGFALISLDRDASLLARLPFAGILGSLGPRRIALAPGPAPPQAHASVEVVTEQAPAIAPSLLRYRAGALFVRPDHYVAAIVDLAKPASSLARLERLMASSWRTTSDAES